MAALIAVVAMAACGPDVVGRDTNDTESLRGRRFASVAVTEDGEPRPLVSGTRIEVTFFKRRDDTAGVRWKAGCNTYGAGVDTTADRLLLEEIGSTDMLCRDELADQDEWLAGFFRSDPHWRLNEDVLALFSDTTVIQLTDRRTLTPTSSPSA